jgi:protein-S-isoprenylcysteine O-methyltransferase Ste14
MKLLAKNLLFTLLVPGTVAGLLPFLLSRDTSVAAGASQGIAAALFAIGMAIYGWCVWDFASFGRGTPAPIDAPKKLVVRGLYHYSRNPMYVGVLTTILAWSVLYLSAEIALYAAVVATAFQLFVRLYEEPHLAREFGAQYAAYCERVGRWLPHLRT